MRTRLFAFSAVILFLAGLALGQIWPRGVEDGPFFNRNRNGIWLDVVWAAEERSEDEIVALSHDLVAKGFRYAYVYVNSVQPDGQAVPSTYAHAARFVRLVKRAQPDLQLIAWIGVVNAARGQDGVQIDDPSVQTNLVAFARLLTDEMGFDGVQWNVEPLPNDSQGFLTLLQQTRQAIGPDKILAIAGHKWAPSYVPFLDRISSYWHSDYYRRVGELVDQVAVMTYDSYAPTPLAYRLFQREQTLGVLHSLAGTHAEVLIGVPTYEEPRTNHNPEAENVANGLVGVVDALARLDASERQGFTGVAIYAHWEMDPAKWATYQRLWQGSAGR